MEADGFLYNMVRAIAGTLSRSAAGLLAGVAVAEVLAGDGPRLAGPTAPPEGLFLMRVTYTEKRRRRPTPFSRDAEALRSGARAYHALPTKR